MVAKRITPASAALVLRVVLGSNSHNTSHARPENLLGSSGAHEHQRDLKHTAKEQAWLDAEFAARGSCLGLSPLVFGTQGDYIQSDV